MSENKNVVQTHFNSLRLGTRLHGDNSASPNERASERTNERTLMLNRRLDESAILCVCVCVSVCVYVCVVRFGARALRK